MSKSIDTHIKPPTAGFVRTRNNIDKAAYVLKGIIDGVNVDGNLVDAEILYLDAWMRSQNSLSLQVIAFDLYQAVNHVQENHNIINDKRTELNELIQNILESGDKNRSPDDELCINEFLSMLKAICANSVMIQPEITSVEAWITANSDISKAFPIKPVYYRIRDAIKGSVNDGEDQAKKNELASDNSGDDNAQVRDANRSIRQVFCDDDEHFSFG